MSIGFPIVTELNSSKGMVKNQSIVICQQPRFILIL
ncbi:unnamed protein product [Brassica oleracea]